MPGCLTNQLEKLTVTSYLMKLDILADFGIELLSEPKD